MRKSKSILGYSGQNPFKDHQARTFGKDKIINEFCPTSTFWSLFNDQHEILIGRRGSGKTILLKMMRYSLLSGIKDTRAKEIISEKKYIGIFAPTYLEFLSEFIYHDVPEEEKVLYFQFAFNCLLSRSLLHEIGFIIDEENDAVSRAHKSRQIAKAISSVWFPEMPEEKIHNIKNLEDKIIKLYENSDIKIGLDKIPKVFKNTICRPIQAVSPLLFELLGWKDEPTWLICIDEAEFLTDSLQRCVNTIFRSDSRNIVIKMATLPFHHKTTETLVKGIFAESNGNDFSYRKIDMEVDSDDFYSVTNSLCHTRIASIPLSKSSKIDMVESLEEFIGKIDEDDLIDYYRLETNTKDQTQQELEKKIISQLSEKRIKSAADRDDKRKSHYDKFAPIFFTREMYKLSKSGNRVPGWYAGAKMLRKISEGNPRLFIRMMNVLFEKARENELTPKMQHSTIYNFIEQECDGTKALPLYGPELHRILVSFAKQLKEKVHSNPMTYIGNSFTIGVNDIQSNIELFESLKLGVALLRLKVDNSSYLRTIDNNTQFALSGCFSAKFWIPMRKGDYPKLVISPKQQLLKFGANDVK